MNAHRVTWRDTGACFSAADGEPLLDAALRHGLALRHDCRLGGCGTCRVHLLQGVLRYDEPPFALDDEARAAGQGLACQGRVHGEIVFSAAAAVLEPAQAALRQLRANVIEHHTPAPGVSRLRLALPPGEAGDWLPGQHLNLLLPDGRRRSFSMANAPGQGEVELHLRHIEGGRFTADLLPRLRPGDTLELELPLGHFHWRSEDELPLLLVATGTGIAPLKALLDALQAAGDGPPAALYWGQRERSGFYLDAEIDAWSRALFEFRPVSVLSRPDAGWTGRRGHVQQAVLDDRLDLAGHAIYLCGSPAMVRDASRAFIAHGAHPERLYTDSFLFQHDAETRRLSTDTPQVA
jgi:CDP-4-dehydro-6-deoxyglucose reductase